MNCYEIEKSKRIPSRSQMESDLKTMNMVKIGEKYGVSDNAVRKWLKKYNLPTKRNDIEKWLNKVSS